MRFRAAHLAYVLLLLSTLGAAETHAQGAPGGRGGEHIRILLQQAACSGADYAYPRPSAEPPKAALPGETVPHIRAAWSVHPPVAHTVAQHAVSGSGL